jgi:hypothetical protein
MCAEFFTVSPLPSGELTFFLGDLFRRLFSGAQDNLVAQSAAEQQRGAERG